jgi:hypothetical protein
VDDEPTDQSKGEALNQTCISLAGIGGIVLLSDDKLRPTFDYQPGQLFMGITTAHHQAAVPLPEVHIESPQPFKEEGEPLGASVRRREQDGVEDTSRHHLLSPVQGRHKGLVIG